MLRVFLFVIGLLTAVGVYAQGAENMGEVNSLLDEYSGVVIDDSVYPFALNTKVFDSRGKSSNRYLLKEGDIVKYRFTQGANGYNQVTHIWVMPAGTKLDQGGEERE